MASLTIPVLAWKEYKYVVPEKENEDYVDTRPEVGVEVFAYNPAWVEPNVCPKGIRIGFRNKQNGFTCSKLSNSNFYKNLYYSGDDFDINYQGEKFYNKSTAVTESTSELVFAKGSRPNLPTYWAPIPDFIAPPAPDSNIVYINMVHITPGAPQVLLNKDNGKMYMLNCNITPKPESEPE